MKRLNFGLLDEFDGAVNALQFFAGKRELPGFAQADADENGVELLFKLREGDIAADFGVLPELHAELLHQLVSRMASAARNL